MAGRQHPIADYGIIGNCETAALVNAHGGIDWLCLPAFDAPSFFGAILDAQKGGEFIVRPSVEYKVERSYLGDTAVLQTRFITDRGSVRLTDFFVTARKAKASFYDFTSLQETRKLVRLIEWERGGAVPLEVRVSARPDYARGALAWQKIAGGFECAETALFASMPLGEIGEDLTARFDLEPGTAHFVVLDYSGRRSAPNLRDVRRWLSVTKAFWDEWTLFNYYRGKHCEFVRRSALTLKLLTYAPNGAFVAAATTSLPEKIGGDKNWDYRFTWLRDTSLFIGTLFRLGYSGEAKAFFSFVLRGCDSEELPVLFPIREETIVEEKTLDHWTGYRGSTPVRIGNRAAGQTQLDNYGHLLQSLFFWRHTGGKIDKKTRAVLLRLTSYLMKHWREPENGIWELPEPRQHTYGKVMAWLGAQRARDLGALESDDAEKLCGEISDEILRRGTRKHETGEYLAESFESDAIDASALLAFTTGFLKPGLARSTREELERRLASNELMHRDEPGKHGGEGAFLLCSFWLVDHLIREGELGRAEELLENLLRRASPLGLLSEEIDSETGEFLGNFPQAFSHLGAIGTILNLHEAKRRRGWHALPEHEKFQRTVGRTVGWRAVAIGFFRVPKTLRLLFSRKSKWRER